MLKIPQNVSKNPIEKLPEDPELKMLYEELIKIEEKPSIVTLEVFKEFEPLFRKNSKLTNDEVSDLTKRYVKLVDFYKETKIIISKANPTVVLTLPSIFTPIRSLEPTDKNAALVAANQKLSHSNVPKYSLDAFKNMFDAIRDEQLNNVPVIKEYRQKYISTIRDFFEKYSKNNYKNLISDVKIQENNSSILNTETTWDIE